jgi:hypothetical protein
LASIVSESGQVPIVWVGIPDGDCGGLRSSAVLGGRGSEIIKTAPSPGGEGERDGVAERLDALVDIPQAAPSGGVLGVKATAVVLDAHGEYAVLVV